MISVVCVSPSNSTEKNNNAGSRFSTNSCGKQREITGKRDRWPAVISSFPTNRFRVAVSRGENVHSLINFPFLSSPFLSREWGSQTQTEGWTTSAGEEAKIKYRCCTWEANISHSSRRNELCQGEHRYAALSAIFTLKRDIPRFGIHSSSNLFSIPYFFYFFFFFTRMERSVFSYSFFLSSRWWIFLSFCGARKSELLPVPKSEQ